MIPISITLKGLYSYQQPTVIDFTNLTAAGLFGIFGAVGSGKSTILEAISFALYGETERLNKADKRSYNMMNLKSNDLLIDFVFTCGDCDDKFRFTVSAKRHTRRFSEAGTFERKSYIWKDNWMATASTAEQILGLSYDNFKRTIIIPQGKFQEFLQLKEGDRVQMLKEIFGLEKYELSGKVSKLTKENDLKVSHIQGQMQSLPEYDEEILKQKREAITALSKEEEDLDKDLKAKNNLELALQTLRGLFEDVKAKTTLLTALQQNQPVIDELDNRVKAFERCEQLFKFPIESRNKVAKSLTTMQGEEQKLKGNIVAVQESIQADLAKVEMLKDDYTNREALLKKVAELEKITSIQSINKKIETLSGRIQKGEEAVRKEEGGMNELQQQLTTIKAEINAAEKALPDTAVLISLNNWFTGRNQIVHNIEKAEQENEQTTKAVAKAKTEIQSKLTPVTALVKLQGFAESLSGIETEIKRAFNEYDNRMAELNLEQKHLQLSQKLDEFAQGLTDDKECPLCGSVHHPKIYSAESVTEELNEIQSQLDVLNNKKTLLNNTLISLTGAYSTYSTYSSQLKQKQDELEKLKSELKSYNLSFNFPGFTLEDGANVRDQLAGFEQKNSALKKLRSSFQSKQDEIEEANKNILKYRKAVEGFVTDKAGQQAHVNVLSSQVELINLEEALKQTETALRADISGLNKQHATITTTYEQAEKAVNENTNKLSSQLGRMEELQKQIEAAGEQKEDLEKQITALLAAEGYQSEKEVEKVLSAQINIQAEKAKIETFRRELHTGEEKLKEALAKVEGKQYEENEHAQLKLLIEKLTNELAAKREQLTTEKNAVEQLSEQMKERQTLQRDLDKLTLRAENLKVLSNLFRGSGFVNYVSSVYLQNLVNSANHRFHKMTRQKLMLELAEDNSFRVRDFMNNGQVRSVKTLSGGQTFQAALSLALALADNIQHLTKSKQNFFFLDEGFGSLDKDALAIVFETLKNLKKENRIVGVISHVDEMQQEIQVNLKIVNDIEKGSLVSSSWH